MRPFFSLLALLASAPAFAQVAPDKAIKTFTVSDPALELSLWASEPLFCNPTCMDIDHRGRVWVCESVNYRHRLHHLPPRRPEGDRIVILEDSTGSGRADRATTFYQSPDTLAPLGIAVAKDPIGPGYKVFVCQSPDVLVFEDRNGDGRADGPPRKLLSGFGGIDHDHGVHGILIGPDGKLYFSVGDQGVRDLPGKNGKRWTSNATDCRAGTIWRCDLDGRNLELVAHNFRNEYEPSVDSFGTVFVSDNDDDGTRQTRICYVMPGGNYGYHPRGPGESHWHEEQPGVVPKILRTGFGAPTGLCVYEGTLLPKQYQGQLLHADAGPRQVRCYRLSPAGAGYEVQREDLVTSTDAWFRPSDVCVAPDGSVYVADWYDPGVGGHGIADFTRGRIYRLAPRGHRPRVPPLDLETPEGLRDALASPALSVRYMATARLATMPKEKAVGLLTKAAREPNAPTLRARAMWQLARLGQLGSVADPEADADDRFNSLRLRIIRDFSAGRLVDHLPRFEHLFPAHPALAREALLGLRDADPDEARPWIWKLAHQYPGHDRFYLEALGIAVGTDPARRNQILAGFDREFPGDDDRAADLVWELRPPAMIARLERRLGDERLREDDRARAADTLAFYDDPAAGEALLRALAQRLPAGLLGRIIGKLPPLLAGKWSTLRNSPEFDRLLDALWGSPDARPAAIRLTVAAAKDSQVDRLCAVVKNPREPPSLRRTAIDALGKLPSYKAVDVLSAHLRRNDLEHDDRRAAVAALATSREGSLRLLALGARGKLPRDLAADVGRQLHSSAYDDVRRQAAVVFPPPGRMNTAALPSLAALARRKGDAARGRRLVQTNAELRCLACHTIRGAGGQVGPDLSLIGQKAGRENLFESILYPSRAVADQYVTWLVETADGLRLSGLVVEETADHLVLRDANGKDTRLDKKSIESRERSPNSLMPADLAALMTEDDLVDVVEFLLTLKTPVFVPDEWSFIGPFDNGANDVGLDTAYPPEKEIKRDAAYSGKYGPVRWRTVKRDEKGYVDLLANLGGQSVQTVSYLYREVESPADQEATILLGTDDCAKLWVNGRLVYTSRTHQAAVPEADRVTARLRRGKNRLLLKITNGDGPHGFYLAIETAAELMRK